MKKVLFLFMLSFIFMVACGGETEPEVVEVTRVITETEVVTEQVEITRVVEISPEPLQSGGNDNTTNGGEESSPQNGDGQSAPTDGGGQSVPTDGGGQSAVNETEITLINGNTANFGAYEGAETDTRFSFGGGGGPGAKSTCLNDEGSAGQFYLVSDWTSFTDVERIDTNRFVMGTLYALACRMPTEGMSVSLTTPFQETVTLPVSVDEYGLYADYDVPLGNQYGTYVATFYSNTGTEIAQVVYTLERDKPLLNYHQSEGEFLALWGFAPNEPLRLLVYERNRNDVSELAIWQDVQVNAEGYLIAQIGLPYGQDQIDIVVKRANGERITEFLTTGDQNVNRINLSSGMPPYTSNNNLGSRRGEDYVLYAEVGQYLDVSALSGNDNVVLRVIDPDGNEIPIEPSIQVPSTGDFLIEVFNQGDADTNYTLEVGLSVSDAEPIDDLFAIDTDGDGLSDGEEVNSVGTDPNNADTDGDGRSDGDEVYLDTDPNDPMNVDGVTLVRYGGGQFVLSGPGQWTETNGDGTFVYQENGRDPWSIYLYDTTRGLDIQLDIWTMEVKCNSATCAAPVLFFIDNVSEGVACPFVFTFDEAAQTWAFDTTIITNLVGPGNEQQQWRALQQFDGRLLIREVEPEISHLDQVYVVVVDTQGQEFVLEHEFSPLQTSDDEYFIMHQGDEQMLIFPGYESLVDVDQVWVVAEGYYEPLP